MSKRKSKKDKPKAIVIGGPTGVGKTSFAIELAKLFQGEIIGADSMQIYRLMDIGTAKPTLDERSEVPHYMVDFINPDEPYDAEAYAKMAFSHVLTLHEKKRLPFVVGGTGLYIKSLIYGLFDGHPVDKDIRFRLKKIAHDEGNPVLYERLQSVDPDTAAKLHVNDTYRIIRALEVYEASGVPISTYHQRHQFREARLDALILGLHLDREHLYERIDKRVDIMLAEGLLDEVRQLRDAGYDATLKSMQSIGYRHMIDFLEKRIDWLEAVRTLKRDTRRYAKRQMTWFGAIKEITWIHPGSIKEATQQIERFLNQE